MVNNKKRVYGMKIFEEEQYANSLEPFIDTFHEQLPRQIIFIALVVVLIIFFFLNLGNIGNFLKQIFDILIPIILGWVLSLIVSPFYDKIIMIISKSNNKTLQKHSKLFATAIIIILVVLLIVLFGFIIMPHLYTSISNFASKTSEYARTIRNIINDIKDKTSSGVTKRILDALLYLFSRLSDAPSNIDIAKSLDKIFSGFYTSVKTILNIFIASVVMIYALNMKESFDKEIKRVLHALFRKDIAKKIIVELKFAKGVFSGYLFGMILDSFFVGIAFFVGAKILGMPYSLIIGFLMGSTNLIPFFGPVIGGVPSFLLILLDDPLSFKPYEFIILLIVIQQVEGNIIGPKILGDKTGVGSFWVLFSILLFGGLFGVVGMVIAVPLWAIITRLFNQYIDYRLNKS